MPGRALATPLVQKLEQGLRFPPKHCARCLKACEPAKVPYCITHALIEAVKGNVEEDSSSAGPTWAVSTGCAVSGS